MEKIHETCMFLCFHVNFNMIAHKFPCELPFSAYILLSPHYNGKGSTRSYTHLEV